MKNAYSPQTTVVRSGIETDQQHGAVVPPLYLSSNFSFKGLGEPRPYDYTRSGNPTRDQLARALCDLEQGVSAIVTSSGMSAIALVLQSLLPGSVVIAPHDCYGGTFRLLSMLSERGQIEAHFVDQSDGSALSTAVQQLGERIALFWVETPSNPLLRVTDIQQVVSFAREVDARVAVDNTFLSPALQTPLTLGADIVVHSTTKYLNGHSDVVGGAVVAADTTVGEELAGWANCLGLTGSPFDSYQTLRGLRTLHTRIRAHEENAGCVANFLSRQSSVGHVYYPGLSDHPGHEIAKRQQAGFGGMISFEVDESNVDLSVFIESLQLFSLAESLGGVESLVCHPATMTHAPMDAESRAAAGITDSLIRLSIGIEHGDDLVNDLNNALGLARIAPLAATA